MIRTPIQVSLDQIPEEYHALLDGASAYDSSCSLSARVIFIDRDGGYFLKSAPKGALRTEAEMTAYFHAKGLSAQMLSYQSLERDWMLTTRVHGEDCTHADALAEPERLCDFLGERLRMLHELDCRECPVQGKMDDYLSAAARNYRTGQYDKSQFPDSFGYASAEEAWAAVQEGGALLKADVLVHGDYCLPNVMMDDWKFSGFIDVGNGGVGDRHIDLFWGTWSLWFNLKTDRYTQRFFDAYGRDKVDAQRLRVVAAVEVFG